MIRSIVILALALTAGASSVTAGTSQQKKKAKTAAQAVQDEAPAALSDSLSYAAGMSITEGLQAYLSRTFGITAKEMGAFEEAFLATMEQELTPELKARAAGQQVAFTVVERMLPKIKEDIAGGNATIDKQEFTRGFMAALKKDNTLMADTTAKKYFDTRLKQIKDSRNAANRKAGEDFLAANAKQEGVVTLPSGLQYKVLTAGTGDVAAATDEVTVKYEGRLIDGTVFDSSYNRGDGTTKFRPNQVIKGWTEALTMMPAGSKWQLFIPYVLAYGDRDMGKIKPCSALVFTVEVVSVEKKQPKTTAKTASSAE